MRSSTSSSEGSLLDVTRLVVVAAAPTVAVAIGVTALATLARWRDPRPIENDVNAIIVHEQLARARSLPPVDTLLVGDSSGLCDVSAGRLGALRGRRTESLATMATVMPAGYGRVVELAAKGHALPELLLFLHAESVRQVTAPPRSFSPERAVLTGRTMDEERARNFVSDSHLALFTVGLQRLVRFPLAGAWGRAYGWPDDFVEALRADHGTVLDPTSYTPPAEGPFIYRPTKDFLDRLPALHAAIEAVRPGRVRLVLTPLPAGRVDPATIESRARTAEAIRAALALPPAAIVDTPPAYPDELFASFGHLGPRGRALFTDALAAALDR